MKNTNSNVKNQGRKEGAKVRFCALLAPYRRALGRRAQVGRKLSHEQNRLMRTKVRPAPGKPTLVQSIRGKNFRKINIPSSGMTLQCGHTFQKSLGRINPTRTQEAELIALPSKSYLAFSNFEVQPAFRNSEDK